MFLQATPQNRPAQFTPALQKLFNRVLARVYRGNVKKKCSKERLLSLQHTQPVKKSNHPLTITSSRFTSSSNHTLSRKKQFKPEISAYTQHTPPSNLQLKKFSSSYHSERSTDESYQKPDRCKTETNRFLKDSNLSKCPEITAQLMVHSDLLSEINNKIHRPARNRLSLRLPTEEASQVSIIISNKSQCIKEAEHVLPSKIKHMESRRKINILRKTQNKLQDGLTKNSGKHPFQPWDVEQACDQFF